jgi:hypothetical protein
MDRRASPIFGAGFSGAGPLMTDLLEQVDQKRPRSVSPEYARAKQKSTVTVTRHGAGDDPVEDRPLKGFNHCAVGCRLSL